MKKIVIIMLVTCILPLMSLAQNAPVDKLFDKYAGKDGYTAVYITKYMFQMFKDTEGMNSEEADELAKVLGNLNSIKILAVEDDSYLEEHVNFYDEIMKELPREEYNELMVVKEKDSDVVFLAREEKGVIVELLLVVGGDNASDNVLISIQGKIDLENIAKLSKGMGIEGFENLEELEEE
jgi:hypothetical protein